MRGSGLQKTSRREEKYLLRKTKRKRRTLYSVKRNQPSARRLARAPTKENRRCVGQIGVLVKSVFLSSRRSRQIGVCRQISVLDSSAFRSNQRSGHFCVFAKSAFSSNRRFRQIGVFVKSAFGSILRFRQIGVFVRSAFLYVCIVYWIDVN